MKDLRIVIVTWNAQDYLSRCLLSLPEACEGLAWDCIVVDNNSNDETVRAATEVSSCDDRIDVIVNKTNFGFAYACNQGAARHDARYVLLLNADTECPKNSLTHLVAAANRNPDAGIIGPKLISSDGSYQQSVHGFPTLKDQSLILLKLHHIFRRTKSLQKYFARDLDINRPQAVEQVMGACFLVRAACWDQLKGLDPLYFIWFEEVDACKRAIEKGWKVWYDPTVTVMHHGGLAFTKVYSLRRQQYFNDSLRKYMKRWYGLWAWLAVSALAPISLVMSAILTVFNVAPATKKLLQVTSSHKQHAPHNGMSNDAANLFASWFVCMLALEIASMAAQGHPIVNGAMTIIAGIALVVVSHKRPAIGLTVVLMELMIGGFGYLLNLPLNIFVRGISLRMILMAAFFTGWGLNALKANVWRYWKVKELLILQVWVFVAGMVLGGFFRGFQTGQNFIFQDINAWLFLLYFIPVLDVAHRFGRDLKKQIINMVFAGTIWLPLKLLLTFYVFTHGLTISDWLYVWVRDARVGEITPLGDFAYRIFFQSTIYSVLGILFTFAWWIQKGAVRSKLERKINNPFEVRVRVLLIGGVTLSAMAIFLSLSRSFWLGLSFGLFTVIALVAATRKGESINKRLVKTLKAIWLGSACAISAVGLIVFVWQLPIPHAPSGSVWDLFTGRVTTGDPASASRWNLLPVLLQEIKSEPILGHGLGSTVTYRSQDPRVLQTNSDGIYTTYAFEWGWLSLWVKFGIFGILIMGWLLISLGWRVWKSNYDWWIRVGVVAGTGTLAVIHFFTPYLDHPLGFAWILGVEGLLALEREKEEPHEVLV